eukprot:XP_019076476.1 PREDICTED: uncharacterized protein LOC109122868 [Vitis vinifera]
MGWTPIASHGLTLPLATFLPAHWIKEPFIVFRKCLGLLRSGYIPYARRVRASEESILLSSPSSFLEASSATTMGFEVAYCRMNYQEMGIGHNSKMAAATVLRHQF